jgi:hypothetical protein
MYLVNMTIKIQFINYVTPRSFNKISSYVYNITNKAIKMNTVSFTSKRNYIGFQSINFHTILSLLQRIDIIIMYDLQ